MAIAKFLDCMCLGPTGFWNLALLCCAAKLDPFLSLSIFSHLATLVEGPDLTMVASDFALAHFKATLDDGTVVSLSDHGRVHNRIGVDDYRGTQQVVPMFC